MDITATSQRCPFAQHQAEALGGGGYDLYCVVPRAWATLWAEMSAQPLPAHLHKEWITRWRPAWLAVAEQEVGEEHVMGKIAAEANFPTTFEDRPEDIPAQPRR